MNDFNVNNDKEILMAIMAAKGISAEEYARFLNGGNFQKLLIILTGKWRMIMNSTTSQCLMLMKKL